MSATELRLVEIYTQAEGAGSVRAPLQRLQAARAAEVVKRLRKDHSVAVLGDPVGTGKTVVALVAAARLLQTRKITNVLVVAPNATVRKIWETRAANLGDRLTSSNFRVVTLATVPKRLTRPTLVIVDEAHRKSHREELRQLLRFGPGGPHRRLFLTATPFQISVEDLCELVKLGAVPDDQTTSEVAEALGSYGRALTRIAGSTELLEGSYLSKRLHDAASEMQLHAHKVLLPTLTPAERSRIRLSDPVLPPPDVVPMPADNWREAFHVARLVPELTDCADGSSLRASDSFQRGLASSVEAFWASAAGRELRGQRRLARFRNELDDALGEGTRHPKVARTVEWTAHQVAAGSHVAVFCVWDATARALQSSLQQRFDDIGLDPTSVVWASGSSVATKWMSRFKEMDAEPMVLILQERFAESIDLDGGRPSLVHHDLPWNPAKLRQRWGRFVRAGSGFVPIPEEKILIPVLDHESDLRVYSTVSKRAAIGEVLLSSDLALVDGQDAPSEVPDWILEQLRR